MRYRNRRVAHEATLPQARVCGLDISPKVIARAKELDRTGNIDFVVATESDLPFPDSVFDSAVCRFSLHHYPDLAAHFREVRRILRRRGIYLIVEILPEAGQFQTILNDVFAAVERESAGTWPTTRLRTIWICLRQPS